MILHAHHLSKIRNYLINNGLENPEVLDDLEDHLCCMIERKMRSGQDFDSAFDEATAVIAPEDIREIQATTIYYLTIKSKIMLVKGIFITAFLSVFSYVLGNIIYQLLMVAGGDVMQLASMLRYLLQTLGLFIFGFGFLPCLFRFGYQQFVAKLQE